MADKLSAMDIYAWASKPVRSKGGFTTGAVVDQFNIPMTRAAAFIAILRIKEKIQPGKREGGPDGTSHWMVA